MVFSILLLAGCDNAGPSGFAYSGAIMGTTYHVKVVASEVPENLGEQILSVLNDLDRKMSTYKPDSELNRLNGTDVGDQFAVSQELLDVLLLSRQVFEYTGGAFDPTVGPLVDLWGFGPSYHEDMVPDPQAIESLLADVGFAALAIDQSVAIVTKTKPLSLDLSAVAKGYAADRVAELIRGHGLSNYMVEVGGEMMLSGTNDRGTPWQIAIEKADSMSRSVQQVLGLTDAGVATSGDYRNYFEKDGVRYSHTLDPRTGYPISHDLASVTVVSDSSGLSDALATAFIVMGAEQALALAERDEIAIYTLSKSESGFQAAYSPAFEQYLTQAN